VQHNNPLRRIIPSATNEGDIVIDFTAGSGTTGATAHKMNGQYILIKQIDSQIGIVVDRMMNVREEDKALNKAFYGEQP
jgi:adenine-specific DNA-methyltransferase